MAYVLSDFMVPYLLRLYHAFDGDLAEIVVLGEIAQRNASRFFADAGQGERRSNCSTTTRGGASTCSPATPCRWPNPPASHARR
jgi:hypothetical protein